MEKTAEYLKAKGWTVRVVSAEGDLITLWHHPVNDWEVDFIMACELQLGIELKEMKANAQG